MISVILVVYKAKKKLLNKFCKKISSRNNLIIINIDNYNFDKIKLPKKTQIINAKNNGYGAAINLGLKICKTKYAIISQIDVNFKKNFINKFYQFSKKIRNFAILIPNEKGKILKKALVENTDGEASTMLINVEIIKKIKFDENIFLYFEESDLFHRCKKKKYKVFDVKNFTLKKQRASSISYKNNDIECLMKWHYMWSMFYFYKKNFNYFYAFNKTYMFLLKDLVKLFMYICIFDKYNCKIRFYRLYGLICSIIGINSFKRP